jgi:ligand-binding sensor domain-containing protein
VTECITSLSADPSGNVWVGTSSGRLLLMTDERWTLQAHFTGIQITGIAFEKPNQVWLSTSDGIRRLDNLRCLGKDENTWKMSAFPIYYRDNPQ